MNFRTMVKSLRLSWIGRLLDGTNANWKAIPEHFFSKHGGLTFLLKCNYDVNLFESNFPLFYRELLRIHVLSKIEQCIRRRTRKEIYTVEQQGYNY